MTTTANRPFLTRGSAKITGLSDGNRPAIKPRKPPARWWSKIVPVGPARSNVVLLESLQLHRPTDANVIEEVRRDQLKTAHLVRNTRIRLTFADDHTATLPIDHLGMPVDRIRWDTVQATPSGDAMTVTAIKGEQIAVAATTLRYLADPDYAAQVEAKITSLRDMLGDLDEGETPAGMFDGPTIDPVVESWK